MTSPVHGRPHSGITKDDSAVLKSQHSPPHLRRGSDGSKTSREAERGPRPSGKAVNKMLGLFESGHESQPLSTHKPLPPPSPSRVRPIPPAKPSATKKGPTQPSVQPLVKLQLHEGDPLSRTRVPILPPNGRANVGKHGPGDSGKQAGKVAVWNRDDSTTANESSKGSGVAHKGPFSGGEVKKKIHKMFASSGDGSKDKQGLSKSTCENKPSATHQLKKNVLESIERKRANSAEKAMSSSGSPQKTPHMPPGISTASNKKGHSESAPPVATMTTPPALKKTKSVSTGPLESAPPVTSMTTPPALKKPKAASTGYENVNPPRGTECKPHSQPHPQSHPQPHSQPHPKPPSQDDLDYENLSYTNRDSDVYENVGIGFAGTGDMAGPLPPLPLARQPVRQSYENVEIGVKSPARGKRKEQAVEEDDDMLFGKEGPPGMQEMIYENFGPDKGNRLMSIEQLAAHVEKLGKKGLSTEYYRIRNEPITGLHKACRYVS